MNTKIFLLLLGLLLISVRTDDELGDEPDTEQPTNPTPEEPTEPNPEDTPEDDNGEETPDDDTLCHAKETDKDGCFKVELSADDKKCCFYDVTPPAESELENYTTCALKLTEAQKKEYKDAGYEFKEECSGKFITTSILALLALLFL